MFKNFANSSKRSIQEHNKATDTVYALREHYDKCEKKQSELMERSGKINELTRNNSDLQRTVDSLTEFIDLLKRFEPQKYAEIKQVQEYVHSQQKPEIQQQSTTKEKKSWGPE